MALKFQDWGLSPEETIREREKAYDKYINIAEPAYKEKEAAQRGELASELSSQAAQAARMGRPEQISGLVGQAQAKAAEMLPQQGQEKLDLQVSGARMKEDMIAGKQMSAITKYLRDTEEAKDQAATALAKKAFDLGIQGKELALHQNAMIADMGMAQMYKDFNAGRINEVEIRKLQAGVKTRAAMYKQKFDAEMAKLKGELELEVANKNIAGAKARIARILALAKKAAEEEARANNMASIISGVFGMGGAIIGGIYGGPTGAVAGGKIGSTFGKTIGSAVNANQ